MAYPAPTWEPPGNAPRKRAVHQPFCRVEGMIEQRIGFEAWLPAMAIWNGRLLGAGVGGDAGVYNYHDLARGVDGGFATITNDSGHKVTEANWMMRGEAVLDYTHRSQHLMNVAGRALIDAFYETGPHHAYFLGCSGGGRQGLKEMQRFPGDYDGIVAGAGGPTMPVMSVRHLWQALYQQQNPDGAMADRDWDIVARAAVEQCDADDGVVDGVIENPARCDFDPSSVQCAAGATGQCLSPAQVRTVKTFYAPMRDEHGNRMDSGLVPGVRTRPGPPSPLLLPLFAEGAHHDPDWSADDFHRADDLALVNAEMPEMRADDPDISAFAARGGRAILYQGWWDPSIVAHLSIDYYESVVAEMGKARSDEVIRLFMVPGMLHCRGGAGVDELGGAYAGLPIGDADHDALAAVVRWVEQGKAPDAIIGSRRENDEIVRQHVLCPYPQQAVFRGGNPANADSYECAAP
ncbi:MAG: tannase/feruloyl esterase family alpha/beta hydrolase [Gammaproteobacteria bacterium]|nr:tannase/feruloyl esterase family alpha/beta hydrolase [Gammaproteobacteria bacterium]